MEITLNWLGLKQKAFGGGAGGKERAYYALELRAQPAAQYSVQHLRSRA